MINVLFFILYGHESYVSSMTSFPVINKVIDIGFSTNENSSLFVANFHPCIMGDYNNVFYC